jgi:hypothetical protein
VFVGKLDHVVFKVAYAFEHLVGHLRVKRHGAVLELMERSVVGFIHSTQFFF